MSLAVDDAVRDDLEDAAPSDVMVWLVVQEADVPPTAKEIANATTLSRSAVKRSLKRLRGRGLIRKQPNHRGDARKPLYTPVFGGE